jgi:hypothetical protein
MEDKRKHYLRTKAWRDSHRHPCAVCGKPIQEQSTYCAACKHRGERGPSWNGGTTITGDGYRRVFLPDHPDANQRGYVLEHRLVMERHLGRTLLPTEVVHHINGDKLDNRIENLMLFSDTSGHRQHHVCAAKGKA